MKHTVFWRYLAWALLLSNAFFALWHLEGLRALGLGPAIVREPQRAQDQIHPDRLTLRVIPVSADSAATGASAPVDAVAAK